jgi:PIN domain nuclease of toxin-antitoxin system
MRYLLDTHTYLWFSLNSPKLSKAAMSLIENPDNQIFISMASLWEISIKNSLGKLTLSGSYESIYQEILEESIEVLPINFWHTNQLNSLPFHHQDPFDRMIASQALVEEMDVIGADSKFDLYFANSSISRIW